MQSVKRDERAQASLAEMVAETATRLQSVGQAMRCAAPA
jgi:hypothetical protein